MPDRVRAVLVLPIDVRALVAITFPEGAVVLTEHDEGPDRMVVEWDHQEADDA